MTFANFVAKHVTARFEHRHDLTEGYDHVPLQVTIDAECFEQIVDKCKRPEVIDNHSYDGKIYTHEIRQKRFMEALGRNMQKSSRKLSKMRC